MKIKVKILAFYLPQFHEIPENNNWWGKGFTEWVNVKKAQPLFEKHEQPRIPQGNHHYNLSDVEVMRWQAEIARKSGLYGFCFYHYWFSERPLLEKPLVNYLETPDIDFPYCFCWANESWTNGWAKAETSIIMEQKYGDESEWRRHFDFLLPFFKDERYIKEDNKPFVVIYRPYLCECMVEMLEFWESLAIEYGFSGLKIASQRFENPGGYQEIYDCFDYHIEYQPGLARNQMMGKKTFSQIVRARLHDFILGRFNKDLSFCQKAAGPIKVDYDSVWQNIISSVPGSEKAIAGAFVNWDNTPRHARRGSVFTGVTADKFRHYMNLQIKHIHEKYQNNYMFLFAWNEWGEGGYMEPDEINGNAFLEALRKAIDDTK